MADKLTLIGSSQSYLTMKELAHSGARVKGAPEIYKGILVFPFDDYADGADHILVYCAEKVEANATAVDTVLAQVNFAQNDDLFWDAGASKITNVKTGTNTPIGRVLVAKDLSSAVPAGSTLIFELNPDLRVVDQPVAGVAAGYKLARGTATLDGSNPTTVATGLTTIVAAVACIKKATAPGDDPVAVTVNYSGSDGNLDIYAWKHDGTDPTLVASTNNSATIDWIAIGT